MADNDFRSRVRRLVVANDDLKAHFARSLEQGHDGGQRVDDVVVDWDNDRHFRSIAIVRLRQRSGALE